jgi:hypothetical protein
MIKLLNRNASPCDVSRPVRIDPHVGPKANAYDTIMNQPLSPDQIHQYDRHELYMEGDEYDGDDAEYTLKICRKKHPPCGWSRGPYARC